MLKNMKTVLAGATVASMLVFAPSVFASTENGILTISNATDVKIAVKCPSPIAVPVQPKSDLTLNYGGGGLLDLTVYNALNRKETGSCTFSVNGTEVAKADITLSNPESTATNAYPTFSTAEIDVTVSSADYNVTPTHDKGNELTFKVEKAQ